jgi:hypothetical protein
LSAGGARGRMMSWRPAVTLSSPTAICTATTRYGTSSGCGSAWSRTSKPAALPRPNTTCATFPPWGRVGLLISTAEHYGKRTGRPLKLDHVMAWHLRSYLGEALWRGEAGLPLLLPLPGGGTSSDYVDQLSERFGMLRFMP